MRGDVDKKFSICSETHKSRTVISIGYMSSRFKGKLCMVLSHYNEHNPAAQGKIAMPACWIAFCLCQ